MPGVRRILTLTAAFAALSPIAFLGQVKTEPRPKLGVPPAESRTASRLRIDSNLVLVPVSVCDPQNRPVTGLEKEHFRVLDDHVEQTITHFSMDDEPVAVGLVFDISGSMGPKLQKSRQAAAEFFRTSNVEDEFFLVEFNDQPKLVVPAHAQRRGDPESTHVGPVQGAHGPARCGFSGDERNEEVE